jgi:hypothetical protein
MKFEDEVKGEQGLAALALGKFEGVYEIEEDCENEEVDENWRKVEN